MASIKGTAVDASLRYVRERFDEATLGRVLSGARSVRLAHTACVHRGDAVCRFEAIWG